MVISRCLNLREVAKGVHYNRPILPFGRLSIDSAHPQLNPLAWQFDRRLFASSCLPAFNHLRRRMIDFVPPPTLSR